MAEENQLGIFEEINSPPPVHSQSPVTLAALPVHDAARVATLEGNVTSLQSTIDLMAANMAEMMSLLRGPNRAASSSTVPPGSRWSNRSATPCRHRLPQRMSSPTSGILNVRPSYVRATITVNADPASGLHSPSAKDLPDVECLRSCSTYREPFIFQTSQPNTSLPYQARPLLNMPFLEPGTPTHAAPAAPTNFLPKGETEQERRLKKIEEIVKALQAGDSRHSTSYLDLNLFLGLLLPPKIKVPNFQKYDGTSDPRHHLRHYRGKMFQYWEYEQFVIATFQESLSGLALNWFMSLRAEDIPSWTKLSKKFIDQYQCNTEMPPSFLELITMEMIEGQKFESYATDWRTQAAKHFPCICKAQQIQMFHGTLKGPITRISWATNPHSPK
ncbi:hypothetical protein CRG98_032317 [Punica granatum]|uniref:Retrotransposon gag domain-containing protein n=1 Tax=Punica granatum TaxID=22663 RepID=A0A2I0IU51_PUNGR|nr:hypothetical protein CRG98_032317 [Punica granatum]